MRNVYKKKFYAELCNHYERLLACECVPTKQMALTTVATPSNYLSTIYRCTEKNGLLSTNGEMNNIYRILFSSVIFGNDALFH